MDTVQLVAGRYQVGEPLGTGAFGSVFAGRDLLASEPVAIKFVPVAEHSAEQLERVRREVAVLRLLDDPGVVELRDDGLQDGHLFLVMDKVEGEPFPGGPVPMPWEALRDKARGLLRSLGRVHAAGIMHRDLKPANVLVSREGRPVLLDFGVSGGPSMGRSMTERGTWLGTPAYFSPEQLGGEAVDYRADLYAVGLMLYEALTGVLPHGDGSFTDLVTHRLMGPPPPPDQLEPTIPRHVSDAIMRLLAPGPEERPRTAEEALELLRDGEGAAAAHELPWLGPRDDIHEAITALRARRSVAITGPTGSGRARAITEAAAALAADGVHVRWLRAGSRPFESARELLGAVPDAAGAEDVRAAALAALARCLEDGVLAIRRAEHLDEWTRACLSELHRGRPLLTPIPELGEVVVTRSPLDRAELQALFEGPDLLLHLPEDGAEALWNRTGGHPARIVSTVGEWVATGVARWSDARRLQVSRSDLDKLLGDLRPRHLWSGWHGPPAADARSGERSRRTAAAQELCRWLALAGEADVATLATASRRPRWEVDAEIDRLVEDGVVVRTAGGTLRVGADVALARTWTANQRRRAHAVLGDTLAPARPLRIGHLLASGRLREGAREALALAEAHLEDGQLGLAEVALDTGLVAARGEDDADAETELLAAMVRLGCAQANIQRLDRVLYELGRSLARSDRIEWLMALARESRNICRSGGEAPLVALGRLGDTGIVELDRWRHHYRIRASVHSPAAVFDRVLDDARRWVARTGSARAAALLSDFQGTRAYFRGDFEASFEAYRAAADSGALDMASAINARNNVAAAAMEVPRLDDAVAAADIAVAEAQRRRLATHEARGRWLARAARYRRGDRLEPDPALVEASRHIGRPGLEAIITQNEAVIAWRVGERRYAADWAGRAARASARNNSSALALLTAGLHAATTETPPSDPAVFIARARACRYPGIGLQTLALLRLALGGPSAPVADAARALWAAVPPARRTLCLDVMSPAEALEIATT